jgi:glycosyltransferase involved in cell wall biosynthesis
MKRLRVLFVDPGGQLWGSERCLLDLLAHVDRARVDAVVACPPDTPLIARVQALGFRVETVAIDRLHQQGIGAKVRAVVLLAALLRRVRPDVVHLNQSGLWRVLETATRAYRVPVICHVRLLEDAKAFVRGAATRPLPSGLVAISRSVLEILVAAPQTAAITRLIYDPFDVPAFRATTDGEARLRIRDEFGIGPQAPLITIVGRVCHEKGQSLAVEALGHVRTAGAQLLIVGGEAPGPAQGSVRRLIEERARALGLIDRVHFAGSRDDVADLMAASDVVLLATRADEPFGRVLLESLSVGTAVVAAAVAGPLEILGREDRGWGFPPADPVAMASAVDDALADPAERARRVANGQRFIAERCDPRLHAKAIEDLCAAVAASGGSARP